MKQKIEAGKYIELAYEIFVVDKSGPASVYKFTREKPDAFVMGMDLGMIEGFIKHITGLEEGAKFDFTLKPSEAFGEVNPEWVVDIPRATFEVNGEFDRERVYVGAIVPMQTQEGMRMDGRVTAINEDVVTMDFNHQLAGECVRYQGEVVTVRDALPEELKPKHGCGCGCDCGHDHGHDDSCGGCSGCDGCN